MSNLGQVTHLWLCKVAPIRPPHLGRLDRGILGEQELGFFLQLGFFLRRGPEVLCDLRPPFPRHPLPLATTRRRPVLLAPHPLTSRCHVTLQPIGDRARITEESNYSPKVQEEPKEVWVEKGLEPWPDTAGISQPQSSLLEEPQHCLDIGMVTQEQQSTTDMSSPSLPTRPQPSSNLEPNVHEPNIYHLDRNWRPKCSNHSISGSTA